MGKKNEPLSGLKILFADDEPALQELMNLELPRMGHQVTVCPDGTTAAAALERNSYDCVLVDLDMPGLNGIEVIGMAKDINPFVEAVVLTGKSSLETAVAAMRQGAFDYLTKPCRLVELQSLLKKVLDKRALNHQLRAVQCQLERVTGSQQLVGNGRGIELVKKLIEKVAPTQSTVLVLGETGTGKELVARAIHDQSVRASEPFVPVNCGALPESLIESELFGHRKGAFTGAEEHRVGLFEVANGGTLFLDEIGELPKAMQAKLLRVLECGEIRRVGDNEAFKVDVRLVCATHRNLDEMVHDGDFREDLMFRINTFEVHVPALRDRLSDIPELAKHLYQRFASKVPDSMPLFDEDAMAALMRHAWPGNVRELANVIEHASIMCEQPPITMDHLPQSFMTRKLRPQLEGAPMTLKEIESQAIDRAIERHSGNRAAAAAELGISAKTLYNRKNAKNLSKSA